jgi:hypothetical protein
MTATNPEDLQSSKEETPCVNQHLGATLGNIHLD